MMLEKQVVRLRVLDAHPGNRNRKPSAEIEVTLATKGGERISDESHRVQLFRGDTLEVDALTHVQIGRHVLISRVLSALLKLRGKPRLTLVPSEDWTKFANRYLRRGELK